MRSRCSPSRPPIGSARTPSRTGSSATRDTGGEFPRQLQWAVTQLEGAKLSAEFATSIYQGRGDEGRLPKGKEAQRQFAETVGTDGVTLLAAIASAEALVWLRNLPAVDTLRRVWVQNYLEDDRGLRWRTAEDGIPPAAQFVSSPHDGDAHLAKKGSTCWVGYKVHLTETCEDDAPNLITHVETTPAPMADGEVTPRVHRALQQRDMLPRVHVVDTGFLDAELLVTTKRDYGIDLLGPARPDVKWQAKEGKGFAAQHFTIDWERERATCPEGQTSVQWTPVIDNRGSQVIQIRFSTTTCRVCPSLRSCVQSKKKYPRRLLTVRPKDQHVALQERREREKTPEYAREYARRAGIEGTLSQGVRRCGMRRSRYVGLARTHLGHVLTAAALNVVRVAEWLAGTPRARTRLSPFAQLMVPS